jgi:hypothetical protein
VVMVATVTALIVVEVLDRRRTTTTDATRPAPAASPAVSPSVSPPVPTRPEAASG